MPLFDAPVSPRLLWPLHAPGPRRRARKLLRLFGRCFPELAYDWDLAVPLANAQAFLEDGRRRVRLYGGLVRHRKIGTAGLAVALAHETGHHLGGAPHSPVYRWLSSEERATEWAFSVGLNQVFGATLASRVARRGRNELVAIGLTG